MPPLGLPEGRSVETGADADIRAGALKQPEGLAVGGSGSRRIPKRARYCQLPTAMTITGRSSSITNAFVSAIIPVIEPSEEEELEA